MNDERKKPIPLWPDGCVWILCSSSIGAILKIFLTPIDTSGNDIGAGLGNLIVHPVVHGSIGAIGGAFIGSLAFFLFRNGKNTSPLNAEESVNVIETAIRKATKKPTGELTKADFEKVTELHLSNNKLTEVPKDLEKLTQLKELRLDYNKLTDVKGLEKLTKLRFLNLKNNPDLTKAQIAELKKVLPRCKIYPLTKEESAKVIEAAIRKATKKPTGELTKADYEKVTYLNFYNKQLTDVKGLEKLTQLKHLNLNNNQLTSLKGLENLTQLRFMGLNSNQLTSVKGLENLTKLTELYLEDNPDLTKTQIDELQKALPNCYITSNPTK